MDYKNQKEAHLMIWEVNPNKRNKNNEIKFNISNRYEIAVSDRILCPLGDNDFSVYEITEVINVRPSSIGMNYVTAKTKWYKE